MSFLTYAEIGKELGITKQAVSQNLKKAVNKAFNYIDKNCSENSMEAITMLVALLNIDNHDDFKQMYKLIDSNTQKRIETSDEWRQNI